MNPKVAIVILNWNKKDYVLNLLNSLELIDYDNYEIFIIDNASTDGSVEAIREKYPNICLIVNSENIGGTGGFNTGMNFVLEKGGYQYIWLLDNDVEVEGDSLKELVRIMEEDNCIGIAGSRIVNINDKDITIEAGAFFRWDTVGVEPLFRNKKSIQIINSVEDVDYVAICSALVRTNALKKVGLMDGRYFIFWDDMDWGMQFKKNNFRVVAVLTSVVYHPPFTEKRSAVIDFYYGNRNALLTYAKHTGLFRRFFIYLKHLRYSLKVLFFLYLNGRKDLMFMGFSAIFDFIRGAWGGKSIQYKKEEAKKAAFLFPEEKIQKIIILNTGNREDIYKSLTKVRELYPEATYTLLMQDDRVDMFQNDFHHIVHIRQDKQGKLSYLFIIFLRIFFNNYDLAILPNYPSPFSYAVKQVYHYDSSVEKFVEHSGNRKNIWRLILSTIIGETMSILLLPIIFIRSLIYSR